MKYEEKHIAKDFKDSDNIRALNISEFYHSLDSLLLLGILVILSLLGLILLVG